MNIWLTTLCNLKCKYCYEKNIVKKHNNMTYKIAEEVLEYIEENFKQLYKVNFHGGEPFLNFEIMKYLTENLVSKNANIQIGFTTNGTVWNEDIKKFLIKYRKNLKSK